MAIGWLPPYSHDVRGEFILRLESACETDRDNVPPKHIGEEQHAWAVAMPRGPVPPAWCCQGSGARDACCNKWRNASNFRVRSIAFQKNTRCGTQDYCRNDHVPAEVRVWYWTVSEAGAVVARRHPKQPEFVIGQKILERPRDRETARSDAGSGRDRGPVG